MKSKLNSTMANTLTLRLSQISQRQSSQKKTYKPIAVTQRQSARRNYQSFTNYSKQQQKQLVRMDVTARRGGWRQDHYRTSTTFSVFPKKQLQNFPHNNDKYNVQFLERSLYGRNFRLPSKDRGFFKRPQDQLYSQHYQPIVKQKRSFNETYELRTSLFEETDIDQKREKIMDQYKLQANPFRTPASNSLITTMRRDKRHYHQV